MAITEPYLFLIHFKTRIEADGLHSLWSQFGTQGIFVKIFLNLHVI